MKQVIVITGASSGFGALTARALTRAGHSVYASMRETKGRNAAPVKEAEQYAAEHKVDLRAIELDVTLQQSCDEAIREIIADTGRLDVIVHNAGHMVFGPAEAFTPEQFAELYDVNVLSAQRVNRAALPQLRKQGKGLLIWVSSSSSAGGTPPYLAPYFAAKAAMDRLAVVYAAPVKEAEQYAAEHKVDLRAIELDVTLQQSCDEAIREIIADTGRLDVIVHNAGHMVFGPAEAFTPEQFAEL